MNDYLGTYRNFLATFLSIALNTINEIIEPFFFRSTFHCKKYKFINFVMFT